MAKYPGRTFLLQIRTAVGPDVYSTIGGLTANGLTLNHETIDVTDKGDMPWAEKLENEGLKQIAMSASGFVSDDAQFELLYAGYYSGTTRWNAKLISSRGDVLLCAVELTSLERSGEKQGAEEFTMSFESSGEPTYTPAP